ncbi:MAG: tetratricopeptide repeat protein [Bryobacterales bacterium]|nr:tetratricopeptide repeat protein [Bryobacterales bacterium]
MDRIDALRAMLEADPANHFARYGLAHEFAKRGNDSKALEEFGRILEEDPDYQAAYYHAGKTLERMNCPDKARDTYQQGIDASHRTGDAHACAELEEALALLSD